MRLNVVSMSGGKDSTATAIMAFETQPRESIRLVFADTGNEHSITYDQLNYLEQAFDMPIVHLRRNFDREIAGKREFIKAHWAELGVEQRYIDSAIENLQPTGNPFLDLCLWKSRFPSRVVQFCTQFLKTEPLVEYEMSLIDSGEADTVWSWQGIRAAESARRRYAQSHEEVGGGLWIERPILRWSAADCFEAHRLYGIQPNPLYSQDMKRVGCMPCINAGKDEILAISKRFPEEFRRIAEWERLVKLVSKTGEASFFATTEREDHLNKRGIWNIVAWSKTGRGGRQPDLFRIADAAAECSSSYGLCE